ncbi:MAG: hypothetical protein A4E29_01627 [Methanomassiliicoccales archaeon PtaB.Bin134]|nr:MAG: hypothetical protein A4E29_01627 [Methanomassiliicoccales archaeon PtaB.Bin134]
MKRYISSRDSPTLMVSTSRVSSTAATWAIGNWVAVVMVYMETGPWTLRNLSTMTL